MRFPALLAEETIAFLIRTDVILCHNRILVRLW